MADSSQRCVGLPRGFDHKDGAAKIFKSTSNSSSRVKAAYMAGPTLYDLPRNKSGRKTRARKKNMKGKRLREKFVPHGCAPSMFQYRKEDLVKVSDYIMSFVLYPCFRD